MATGGGGSREDSAPPSATIDEELSFAPLFPPLCKKRINPEQTQKYGLEREIEGEAGVDSIFTFF